MTSMTGCVARTMIVLFVLLAMITGGTVTPVCVRVIAVRSLSQFGGVRVRDRQHERDLTLVFQAVRRGVLRHDNRALVEDAVEEAVRRQQRVERLFDGAASTGP